LAAAQPALGAPLTYDCQARMTRVEIIPPVATGDGDPWQCAVPTTKASGATHWQRNSLEYCRLTVNVYDDALGAARRMAASHRRKQWIVIMDADETVLDNSLFEREGDMCQKKYSDAEWESWVKADMARDVPAAALFTQAVHRLGGLIAIVTNRSAADDEITRHTLSLNNIWFDYEIGKADVSDKTTRWRGAVAALGHKFGGHPKAMMWLGDQITDLAIVDRKGAILRAMSQKDTAEPLGAFRFLLPNPMYGNWQGNPAQ
jgi:5'-nucleotidase (lipoprotein e(P4) family)